MNIGFSVSMAIRVKSEPEEFEEEAVVVEEHPLEIARNERIYNQQVYTSKIVETLYSCNNCQKQFSSQAGFRSHKQFDCEKTKLFRCPYCFYAAFHIGRLQKHVVKKHQANLEEFRCTILMAKKAYEKK
ncbi:unnamed protein product [Acanthoscelides obtectus]|uniref:C2H2-type domain-containing protein n=1 Tax=Acanthoscelides obtectus TaxID=200917 RepID=A0A9P0JZE3_ACAOB|nr:unnamed protein product [Acanthoscelides obtectus]CAK1669746.1 hypothetical protein AOBTE_LOCUS27222 [Acanthoscelides obtectus]